MMGTKMAMRGSRRDGSLHAYGSTTCSERKAMGQANSVTARQHGWQRAGLPVYNRHTESSLSFLKAYDAMSVGGKLAASWHGGCQEFPVMASLPRSRTDTLLISSYMPEEAYAKRRRNDNDPSYTGRRIPFHNMGRAVQTTLRRRTRVLLGKGRSGHLTAAPCAIRHDDAGWSDPCRTCRRTPQSDARSPRRYAAHRSHRTSCRWHTRSFSSSPRHSTMGVSHGIVYRPSIALYLYGHGCIAHIAHAHRLHMSRHAV